MTNLNPSYPIVSFGLDDRRVKNNISTIEVVDGTVLPTPPYTNFSDFETGDKTMKPYATYEPDYWVLDGNYKFMPSGNLHTGYWAANLSDAAGNTYHNSTLYVEIDFSASQSLSSLALHFDEAGNEWCSHITIFYIDHLGSSTIRSYSPTQSVYSFPVNLSDVQKLYIFLTSTVHPYRFPRLTAIDWNATTWLDSSKIKDAIITEEYSPISDTLTANSLELDLIFDTSSFSIVNPDASYTALTVQGMPFTVYEVVNNVSNFMGVFFLESWDNGDATDRVVKFTCLDTMGLAGRLPFYGWVQNIGEFPTMMDYVLKKLSGLNYGYDSGVDTYTFYPPDTPNQAAYLEPSSVRDFLQKCAMALRLGVTCRTGSIYFSKKPATKIPAYLSDGDQDYSITLSQEKITKVSLLPLVTGVKFVWNFVLYPYPVSSVIAFQKSLSSGNYIVSFERMRAGVFGTAPAISGASWNTPGGSGDWERVGAFAYDFYVSSAGTVTIADLQDMEAYSNALFQKVLTLKPIVANAPVEKYAEVDATVMAGTGAPFASALNSGQAQWLADYFSTRYYQDATVFETIVHAGDIVKIDSLSGKHIIGIIESATINLVGLRSDIQVVGKVI